MKDQLGTTLQLMWGKIEKLEKQQADRIAELEHCLIVEQEHNEMLEKENDEPVAWMLKTPTGDFLVFEKEEHPIHDDSIWTPLYTRPSKQLSDKKIWKLLQDNEHIAIEFARAIIKEMNK